MTLSMGGMIGAAIGLLCALVTYVAVVPHLKGSEAVGGTVTGPGNANANAGAIRAILLADFVVLAAVGYYVGQLLD
jgi:hypothetical protein